MKLARLSYAEFAGTANEWRVDKCLLGDVNLLVGMNASGKSRTLNVIKALADLVCGDDKLHFLSGDYEALFDDGGRTVQYSLKYDDLQVVREVLKVDGADRITRGPSGEGRIHAERVGEPIDFRVPLEALACVSKRDALQHPFLEPLYQWGKCMRHYPFGSPLGKDSFIIPAPGRLTTELNLKDPNCVVALFRKASTELGDGFVEAVRADMRAIRYELDAIQVAAPLSLNLPGNIQGEPKCLIVKEHDLSGGTDQYAMSQGMFRTFALLIHMNYAQLKNLPSLVLVDDVGEGLDFERSTALIKLVVNKAQRTGVQLVMATNDRFVMNAVDLRYWTVVQRVPGGCRLYNYENARPVFEKFQLTGLSNFDLLASGYLDSMVHAE